MTYRIITDTGCDLSSNFKDQINIDFIPFHLAIGDNNYMDSDELNTDEFLSLMTASSSPIKSACPSPDDFLSALEKAHEDNIFLVTISSKLSGSYNSAKIAVDEYKEKNKDKNIHLVDSKSASAGQSSLVLKIADICQSEKDFDSMVKRVEEAVESNHTYFILERFDNLVKNGRMPRLGKKIAGLLNIKPIMKGSDGDISLHEINRGVKKSMNHLVKQIGKDTNIFSDKTLVISHIDAMDKASFIREKLEELYDFKKILILRARGLATVYADKGGIVIGF